VNAFITVVRSMLTTANVIDSAKHTPKMLEQLKIDSSYTLRVRLLLTRQNP